MASKKKSETVAQAYLDLLSLRGIDYFFGNSGTDFAGIVDAFALRETQGKKRPVPLGIPHEIPLVSMAHGYYLATGRPQAAMVHVGVGTANSLGGIMAAYRSRIPILFSAGRTPITEAGRPASRSGFIQWAQESFDQAGILREYVKWDYELRLPEQLETVVDRALNLATSEPCGPVYLTLPREILSADHEGGTFEPEPRFDLPTFYPDPVKIEEAARLLKAARFPLIITSSIGKTSAGVRSLVDLAEKGAIGVVSFFPEYMNFPTNHPCHLGFSSDPYFSKADVVLVVDSDVPWYPNKARPQKSATIIQAGIDPLYSRYPIRSFPSDLTLQGDSALILSAISKAIDASGLEEKDRFASRRKRLIAIHDEVVKNWNEDASKGASKDPIDFNWVSYNVNQMLQENSVVVNEYDNCMKPFMGQGPGSYFCSPHAGYLGWGVGAALGIKLGLPESDVIATVGDGSYMFSVPSACHFVSNAYKLPILVIVYNNQCWGAVKRATRAIYPDGWAVGTNNFPMSDLKPTAGYEKICEAFGGYGERVEHPDQIRPALKRALHAVRVEKRQAVLNVVGDVP